MRGDIYALKAPRSARGREQAGRRLCVVVQSDEFDSLSTWLVAPTSSVVRSGPLFPRIDIGAESSTVLVPATRAVDPSAGLGQMVGRASLAQMQEIDQALRLILALD